jgi:phosphoserine phosphatase RsbU/P
MAGVVYALSIAGLPRLRGRRLSRAARERLLLAADLLFSAAVFLLTGGILSPYFGLLYLALIHAAVLLGPRAGLGTAMGAAALVVIRELTRPGGRGTVLDVSFALGKLPFLPLIIWAAGRLAQQVREREVALRQTERRTLVLEATEAQVRQEMEAARRVQESLLPAAMLPPPGLTVATIFCPAREVGGDIYDLIELPDGRLLVAIADVCGKGLAAALLSVAVQQGIRQFAQLEPAVLLAHLNRLLLEKSLDSMFVTAACVVIDPNDGMAEAAVAGHPPPLRWDNARQRLVPLHGRGLSLGLLPDWSGPTERCWLSPGDALLLYTDGVMDAKLSPQERLGEERLAELLGRTAPASAQDWIERLRGTLDGCAERPDDVTVVAIGREPLLIIPEAPLGRTIPGARGVDAAVREPLWQRSTAAERRSAA